ncbi:MAG: class C beta-lactamase-related serine hydrolase [Candidatus Thorarchaeota archaeon]|nr:MAG: class C beta-lactamase-related serine hydrolase [Candidatus Thorarchaeota archaeon]
MIHESESVSDCEEPLFFIEATILIRMRLRVLQVLTVIILLTLVQVGSGNPNSSYLLSDAITYFSNDEWTATTPEEQGMNSTILDEMIQFIEDESAPIKGLVVTRNGYIVKEGYWSYNTEITTHQIFSCTKSFTGALVGIAIKEGFIDNVSQKVLDFFPEMTIENMDSRKGNMTLEHVLTMTTGLDWNEWNTTYQDSENMYNQMFGSPNPIQFFLNLPTVYDPGEHWVYTTGASHLLSAIIQEATSMTTREFAEEYLFDPLNMTIGGWAVDLQGINNGGTQLYVTSRGMAKLGLLYLNNGSWDGQEIMTEEYAAQSIYPHISIDATRHYGYQWWLNSNEGYFSARGSNGQYIIVVPEYNIVISIAANADEPGEDINENILEFVLNSIIEEAPETTTGTGDYLLPIIGVGSIALLVVVVAICYVRKS